MGWGVGEIHRRESKWGKKTAKMSNYHHLHVHVDSIDIVSIPMVSTILHTKGP